MKELTVHLFHHNLNTTTTNLRYEVEIPIVIYSKCLLRFIGRQIRLLRNRQVGATWPYGFIVRSTFINSEHHCLSDIDPELIRKYRKSALQHYFDKAIRHDSTVIAADYFLILAN